MATAYIGANLTVTAPRLLRFLNATPANLGNAPTATVMSYNSSHGSYRNVFIRFAGKLYFYARSAASTGQVYISYDDGQSWTSEVSHTDSSDNTHNPGFYIVYVNGNAYLCLIYWNGSALIIKTSSGDGSWSAGTNIGGVSTRVVQTMVFGDRLVVVDFGTARFFNPSAGTYSSVSLPSTPGNSFECFVNWNSVLWFAYMDGGNLRVRYISAGAVVTPPNDLIAALNPTNYSAGCWVDPSTNDLIILHCNSTGNWHAYSYPAALTGAVDRTSTMLTGGTLQSLLGSSGARLRAVFYDQDSNVGGAPDIYAMVSSNVTAGSPVSMFKYNGVSALMGDGSGAPQDSGGDVQYALVASNIGGERFYTARPVGVDGPPEVELVGPGSIVTSGVRRKFKAYYPRSEVLTTIGGSPATHDLSSTPISTTPIQAGSVTIRGVISTVTQIAQDNGAGAFPVSTLLPAGGTINYNTGAMTGTTASLDASSTVEALSNSGTVSVRFYRALSTNEYPGSTSPANLSNPTDGAISGGNQNDSVPADGTECQITVDMTGFSTGDRFSMQPFVL